MYTDEHLCEGHSDPWQGPSPYYTEEPQLNECDPSKCMAKPETKYIKHTFLSDHQQREAGAGMADPTWCIVAN